MPFTLTFTVASIVSAASAACTILENTVDDGPYPCVAVQNPDGTWALTVSLLSQPAGLAPGNVQIQYGDWPLPQASPATFTAQGSPVLGTLSAPLTATLDWDVVMTGPFVGIAEGDAVLQSESTQPVHLRWSITDAELGTPILMTGNSAVILLEMAITQAAPQASDWQPAQLLTRTAADGTAGEYTALEVGPSGILALSPGKYRLEGRLTTTGEVIVRKAPGPLTVQD